MNIPLTPVRCLYRAVDLYAAKEAIICGPDRFTYSQFAQRCERLASGLKGEGIQPGDRIAYLSFNTHKLLEGYYGVVMAHAIVMPLNVRLTPAELISILNHSGARVLLFENDFAPLAAEQLGVNMQTALANLLRRIPSDDLDLVITAINVQREVGGNLAEILDTISFTIRERVRIKGEIRVLTTQVMYSGRFLSLLPVIVLGVLYLLNKEYMMEFFKPESNHVFGMVPCGYLSLGVGALLIIAGYFVMNKLGEIEV